MRKHRRRFLGQTAGLTAASVAAGWGVPSNANANAVASGIPLGDGELLSLSDGFLSLPVDFVLPESIEESARLALLEAHGLGPDTLTPDCNITLWKVGDRRVLFDVGAGSQFMSSAGRLPESLELAGIDPLDVTDVVFTHGHPDHLWGLIDDFDDLAYPNASYHMHRVERDYWLASDTLDKTPDARKPFVVGAQNRLPLIDERLELFDGGDEVLPGLEAVDTRGHTPGHTSFALHAGSESLVILGDALSNAWISFERPAWPSGSDQDPEQGVQTRLALLDRLAAEQSSILGFHLPVPGVGKVERSDGAYRFVAREQ